MLAAVERVDVPLKLVPVRLRRRDEPVDSHESDRWNRANGSCASGCAGSDMDDTVRPGEATAANENSA